MQSNRQCLKDGRQSELHENNPSTAVTLYEWQIQANFKNVLGFENKSDDNGRRDREHKEM